MVARLSYVAKAATIVAFSAVIAGCNLLPVRTVHDYCQIARPLLVSQQDILTDGTAKQILSANETGAKVCHWKNEPHKTK